MMNTKGNLAFKRWWDREVRRAQREGRRFTRVGFAHRLGIGSGQAVSQWYSGRQRPAQDLWPALHAICGIPPGAWMSEDEKKRAAELRRIEASATGTEG